MSWPGITQWCFAHPSGHRVGSAFCLAEHDDRCDRTGSLSSALVRPKGIRRPRPAPEEDSRGGQQGMSRGGVEHVLRHGSYTATVTEVGAGLRQLRYGEQELVRPYPGHAVRPRFSGAVLAPWPNRIVDGRYTFEGLTHQLPLTEPERNHALHALVCWDRFSMSERSEDSVTLVDRLVPQTGYPFDLEVEVTYSLDGTGLHQAVTGRNVGNDAAPWGTAPHPSLRAGTKRVDDIVLTVPAERFLEVTPDRYLPLDLIDL